MPWQLRTIGPGARINTDFQLDLTFDEVVLSLGVRGSHTLYEKCAAKRPHVYEIGNTKGPGRIADAIRSAHELAISL